MSGRSVLISGVGIAGPTLAYWLLENGFQPTLIERAPRLRSDGYIIDFWGRGYDIAERMNLTPAIRREGYHVQELRFVDAAGRRVGGFGASVFAELTSGRYVSLPRSDLSRIIFQAVEKRCEVVFGEEIAQLDQGDRGVMVGFRHLPSRSFDLVVGADGLHSKVRRLVFGEQVQFERPLGYMVAAFEAQEYRPRDEGVYVSHAVPGKQVARFALKGGRTLFLFVFAATQARSAAAHDLSAQKAVIEAEFGNVGWECPQILAGLGRAQEFYFDRVSQIRMDRWSSGRVALVGDSAFCPSLLAGQGAALAMIAAYVLAGELGQADADYATAFDRYEKLLHSFIGQKQIAAQRLAGSFAPATKLGIFVRNQVSKMMRVPFIANFALGRGLRDDLVPPEYRR